MKEGYIMQLMVFTFMLKAVENATSPDIGLLFTKDEKQEYNNVLNIIKRFTKTVQKRFPAEHAEFFDDNSYAYLDILTLLRNPKYAPRCAELFQMMKLFADGEAKITYEDEVDSSIPNDALIAGKNDE